MVARSKSFRLDWIGRLHLNHTNSVRRVHVQKPHFPEAVPLDTAGVNAGRDCFRPSPGQSSVSSRTDRKASWEISTFPTCFIRFLPSFCFSRSFLFLVMSPP